MSLRDKVQQEIAAQAAKKKTPGQIQREKELQAAQDAETHAVRRFMGKYGEAPRVFDYGANVERLGDLNDRKVQAQAALERQVQAAARKQAKKK